MNYIEFTYTIIHPAIGFTTHYERAFPSNQKKLNFCLYTRETILNRN